MNITFLTPNIYLSGGVKIILQYANGLAKRGHSVTVISPYPRYGIMEFGKARITFRNKYLFNILRYKPKWISIIANIKYVPSFDEQYIPVGDVIVATAWQTASFVEQYSENKGLKYYLFQHYEMLGPECYADAKEIDTFTYKLKLNKIVTSSHLKNVLKQKYNEDSDLISNAIDHNVFYPIRKKYNNDKKIFMLYHKARWKGINDGIKAFEMAKKRHPELELHLYGSCNPPVGHKYCYHQNPGNTKLRDIFNACDIFLCPSWQEGFGLPGAEAMACKCAVVTTDTGGSRDYAINNVTALVSPPRQPKLLAENLLKIIEDDKLLKRVAQKGYEYIKKFRWGISVNKMEKIFYEGLKQNAQNVISQHLQSCVTKSDRPKLASARIYNGNSYCNAKASYPKVSIIILSWNGLKDTIECLESVQKIDYPNYETIVVDNASTDGSSEKIKKLFPEITLIQNKENFGFAEGNNVGIRYALKNGTDYIFLLNNDAIADSQILRRFMHAAKSHSEIGILTAKIYYYSEPNKLWYAGIRLDKKKYRFYHIGRGQIDDGKKFNDMTMVDYASGCALFCKKDVIDKVGLFNPKYFLTYEETDWCYRAKTLGINCIFVPQAKVWHKASSSVGGTNSPLHTYFLTRNRLLWAKENLPLLKRFLVYLTTISSFFPCSFSSGNFPLIKKIYWDLLKIYRTYRDPQFKAKIFGIRDFIKKRFGNCPLSIRKLNIIGD